MQLSIVTPAAPNRKARIASIFERLKLNKERHPDIEFEFIIVDDSMDREYREIATSEWNFPVKYVSLPLTEPYPNPSYMRNVGFRIAEGRIFTMIDSDHWIHEDFVEGAMEPFLFNNEPMLNTGFMIDTSKGHKFELKKNDILIEGSSFLTFDGCMELCGIKGPVAWVKVWLAAYPGKKFLKINGYDEHYVTGYSREDDDIYYRMATKCRVYNKSYRKFAGVHLWHPQGARNDSKNALNHKYYGSVMAQDNVRNKDHQWGKFVQGSFSIINGEYREFVEHEKYVASLRRVKPYIDPFDMSWDNFGELQRCVTKKS